MVAAAHSAQELATGFLTCKLQEHDRLILQI